jgi:hypothetical protein
LGLDEQPDNSAKSLFKRTSVDFLDGGKMPSLPPKQIPLPLAAGSARGHERSNSDRTPAEAAQTASNDTLTPDEVSLHRSISDDAQSICVGYAAQHDRSLNPNAKAPATASLVRKAARPE